MHEQSTSEDSCFVTLTYDDDHIPPNNSLVKGDVQKFWKRLRKSLLDVKIRYFCCGEYGMNTQRPHYHAIIFGIGVRCKPDITRCWQQGFVTVSVVNEYRARYTARYCMKKLRGLAQIEYGERQPPFQLQSLGIGRDFLAANKDQLVESCGCTVHGVSVGLPRYYKKKLGESIHDRLVDQAIEREQKRLDAETAHGVIGEFDVMRSRAAEYRQHDRNIRARLAIDEARQKPRV